MNKLVLTATILAFNAVSLAFTAFGASAADLAPQYKAMAPVSVFNWSGFYVGANAGGGIASTTIDDKNCDLSCSSQNMSKGFGTVGATAGYNYQFGPGLLGIEGDFNWAGWNDSITDTNWGCCGTIHTAKSDWFATVRARFGLAVDRVLVYGTGGVAFVDRRVSGNSLDGSCSNNCFAINDTTVGVVGGVGAEYAFGGPWSAKIEYLHVATPTKRTYGLLAGTNSSELFGATTSLDIVRAGINYRFGGF